MDGQTSVRFGMVGLGIGRSRCEQVRRADHATLAAICDLRADVAQQAAEAWGCAWTTSFDELIDRRDVDVVGIYTPSGLHGELARRACDAGKHVITTKPMDVTLDGADQTIERFAAAGKLLAVDFESRFSREFLKVNAAITAGRLGKPILGDVIMKWYRAPQYFVGGDPPGWRGTWRYDGGGSLANQGVHYVDLLQWLMGPIRDVRARTGIFAHEIETEDVCQALLTFQSGAWGLIETTTTTYKGLGTTIQLHGDQGTIVTHDGKITTWDFVGEHGSSDWEPPAPSSDFPHNTVEDMISALTRGTSLMVPGTEGRKSLALIDAVYRSARDGGVETTLH